MMKLIHIVFDRIQNANFFNDVRGLSFLSLYPDSVVMTTIRESLDSLPRKEDGVMVYMSDREYQNYQKFLKDEPDMK